MEEHHNVQALAVHEWKTVREISEEQAVDFALAGEKVFAKMVCVCLEAKGA